jgi:hypothetical protein
MSVVSQARRSLKEKYSNKLEEMRRQNHHEIHTLVDLIKTECSSILMSVTRAAEEDERIRRQQQEEFEKKLKSQYQKREMERRAQQQHREFHSGRQSERHSSFSSSSATGGTSGRGTGTGTGHHLITPEMLSPEETEELVKSILHRSSVASVSVSMSSSDHDGSYSTASRDPRSLTKERKERQFSLLRSQYHHSSLPTTPAGTSSHRYSSVKHEHEHDHEEHGEEGEEEERDEDDGTSESINSQQSLTVRKTLEGREKILKLMDRLDSLIK